MLYVRELNFHYPRLHLKNSECIRHSSIISCTSCQYFPCSRVDLLDASELLMNYMHANTYPPITKQVPARDLS